MTIFYRSLNSNRYNVMNFVKYRPSLNVAISFNYEALHQFI